MPGADRGATFIVTLPLDAAVPAQPCVEPSGAAASIRPHRVLVVDDNADVADTLAETLRISQHEVEVAYHGRAALQLAREFKPDVVICDIGLPEMSGYDVARAFRADPQLSALRLVALTGYPSGRCPG